MSHGLHPSEIRHSIIRSLLDKVRRQNYEKYLVSLRLERIRLFSGAAISFDFPVTALIGPNGGGKTTILGVCGCILSTTIQQKVFQRSSIGDDDIPDWQINYEAVDRTINPKGTIQGTLLLKGDALKGDAWTNSQNIDRDVSFLSLMRTLPLSENPNFHIRSRLIRQRRSKYKTIEVNTKELDEATSNRIKQEGERVLGKSLAFYRFYEVTATVTRKRSTETRAPVKLPDGRTAFLISRPTSNIQKHSLRQTMYVGKNEIATFSELNFGAGESSVLRIIADIESMANGSLVLVDEIENGLHPIAVRRLVEYLIDVAERRSIQAIFTTHSDYALDPLPPEAIWACLDGRLQQGKLSIEALRAVSGRIDKRLAIFVEDEFVKHWITSIIREKIGESIDEIGIYALGGDGNAMKTHLAHLSNPAISFLSLCYLDGDSKQASDESQGIFRLPGGVPETTVFNGVLGRLKDNVALLTVACQRPLERQSDVGKAVESVSRTNRDPHLLFSQVGEKLGFIPEATVRGAFFAIWIQENGAVVNDIVAPIASALREDRP